ncbi:MAG: dihydrofolate reductase [Saprospiraceae bacterium]|nr:dihydrofolate reductase [Saprospiraceae bacterium]
MKKLICYIAATTDGFIARPDGNIDWLTSLPEPENDDYGYAEFLSGIDTTLMGNATYKEVLGFGGPFPYPDLKNYVFTKASNVPATEYVEFVSGDIAAFVRELKEKDGKDIWLIGGGKINAIMLEAGLIDEMILAVVPQVLGRGIPLFEGANAEAKLNLVSHKAFSNGIIQGKYTFG